MPTVKIFINSAQNFQARFSHLVEKALIQPYPVCSHCLLRSLCPPLAHRELRFVTNFWQWTPFCKDGSPNTVGNFSKKSNFSMRKPYTYTFFRDVYSFLIENLIFSGFSDETTICNNSNFEFVSRGHGESACRLKNKDPRKFRFSEKATNI